MEYPFIWYIVLRQRRKRERERERERDEIKQTICDLCAAAAGLPLLLFIPPSIY